VQVLASALVVAAVVVMAAHLLEMAD